MTITRESESVTRGVKIVLTRRAEDVHACIEGEPEIWAAGRTSDAAIGDLIRSHPDSFDIDVVWSDDPHTQRYARGELPEQQRPAEWPPIDRGTEVRTTKPNHEKRWEWTDEGWARKRWGVRGRILVHHDSHGLCYDVVHEDGTMGCYDPSEIEVV